VLLDPLFDNNPIALQVLGICSALAVTKQVMTALVMSGAVLFVMVFSGLTISVLRRRIPPDIRIIVELTVITTLVIVIDQILKAYFFDISLRLSVFVGLIITNCIVMGRAEAFAIRNPPLPSVLDAIGNALGYGVILVAVAIVRELFGRGSVLGLPVLTTLRDGGWYEPNGLMEMAPAGFLLIGCCIWGIRLWKPEQREEVSDGE
jgi:Na+-transporting NADH:ubiquinone oxidoreductase subunit D